MSFEWLRLCAEGETEGCIPPVQLAYLVAVVIGVVLLAIIAIRSRDLSTATLALMPVAIAINIVLGFTVQRVLNLPIYLDSIGTILVGVLAGPIAGAATGAASNLIWQYAPVIGPGSNIGPFAITSVVIGLLAGLWGWLGVFRSRPAGGARLWLAVAIGVGVWTVADGADAAG